MQWMRALLLVLGGCFTAFGQTDTLIMLNGDVLSGELKQMVNNTMTFKSAYTKGDASLKWHQVARIRSNHFFVVHLADGRRYTGSLWSVSNTEIAVQLTPESKVVIPKRGIVGLDQLTSGAGGRLRANLEVGYSFTRENSIHQITTRSSMSYTTYDYKLNGSLDLLIVYQDSIAPTQRIDLNLGYGYFLANDWYVPIQLKFLSNTQQLLRLRSNLLAGVGKYLVHSNKVNWTVSSGGVFSNEQFTSEENSRRSIEAYAATEVNIFNMGDINLQSSLYLYPGLTTPGRLRADYKIDLSYDLPFDFYVKLGFSLNYDNMPTNGAMTSDYVIQTTLGWKL